jgi:hypothetical protein
MSFKLTCLIPGNAVIDFSEQEAFEDLLYLAAQVLPIITHHNGDRRFQ